MNSLDRTTRPAQKAVQRPRGVALPGLIHSTAVPMFSLDSEGLVIDANRALAVLLGESSDTDFTGVELRALWHDDDLDNFEKAMAWIYSGASDRLRARCRWGTRSGEAIWVRLHLSSAGRDGSRKVLGVVEGCAEELWETGDVEFD